jgi:FO synthase
MFGHIDQIKHWARHLLHIATIQYKTGGFTEFVPLEFVARQSPIFLKGKSRQGPTFRESVLMHAVSRLVFNGLIDNIQTSWVKMGVEGAQLMLNVGANDFGGSLMNETITRSAGASHGQEQSPQSIEASIKDCARVPRQRMTTYEDASGERIASSFAASELSEVVNTKPIPQKCSTGGVRKLVRSSCEADILLVS